MLSSLDPPMPLEDWGLDVIVKFQLSWYQDSVTPLPALYTLIMAVFLINHCKFNGCGLSFPNLLELIQHIEDTHIELHTAKRRAAQQPSCLPLSTVLRFFSPGTPRTVSRKHALTTKATVLPHAKLQKLSHTRNSSPYSKTSNVTTETGILLTSSLIPAAKPSVVSSLASSNGRGSSMGGSSVGTPSSTRESTPVSAVSNSPPGRSGGRHCFLLCILKLWREALIYESQSPPACVVISVAVASVSVNLAVSDGEETFQSENDDSNDSWTTQDEIPADLIVKVASKGHTGTNAENKPYVCPVVGCRKRYKNINGIKYHAKNAHKKDNKVRKPYRCYCGKSYCTNLALKTHCAHTHNNETLTAVTTNTGEVLQVPASQLATKTAVSRASESEGSLGDAGGRGCGPGQITVTGQIIKGGSAAVSKGATTTTTTISSINLTGLLAASGGKIALKALPNGQLLFSQPLEGKIAALVKSDSNHDFCHEDGKSTLIQLKTDGIQQLELAKVLQASAKSSHHQLAVNTSTISVAIPASTLNSLKHSQRLGLTSSAMLARALKSQLTSTPVNLPSVLGSIDSQEGAGVVGGQNVILGVSMEEGTLLDSGDGTLSELSVID
ncbi:Juxtaposed with another zinc finger protein 1 [Chionoecetes opilio]|uniref:Juxtaposed with another zinc finger protein 1 n=1 Tax=Chionoecetes opilio TaxID=41210 RepID=A0A8J5CJL6_CHIOP|nr:Juxtaposed with another zinc finger protein 1 [Chionoecetes opilio]